MSLTFRSSLGWRTLPSCLLSGIEVTCYDIDESTLLITLQRGCVSVQVHAFADLASHDAVRSCVTCLLASQPARQRAPLGTRLAPFLSLSLLTPCLPPSSIRPPLVDGMGKS
jgi:hypothetical protein